MAILAPVVVAAVLGAPPAVAQPPTPAPGADAGACAALTATTSCRLTPSAQAQNPYTVVVPPGVTSMTVVAAGADGTDGDTEFGARGGYGGLVVAELAVTPGHRLVVYVASAGNGSSSGQGWAQGGSGTGLFTSGAGGAATALFDVDATGYTGAPTVVAGGGGGAGGSYNNQGLGGDGGSSGLLATPGATGSQLPPTGNQAGGDPGAGGCVNGPNPDSGCYLNSRDQVAPGPGATGGDGGSFAIQATGGGGGAGYPFAGWGGQPAGVPFWPAGGGGGGGGQSYVAPDQQALAVVSASSPRGGYVTLAPGTSSGVAVQRTSCTSGGNTGRFTTPSTSGAVLAVAVGGRGGDAGDGNHGNPGNGAVAVGTIATAPGSVLDVTAGCEGYGRDSSPGRGPSGGGGKGYDSFPSAGYDGGGGGGGTSISIAGRPVLQAGGGGGPGGNAVAGTASHPVKVGGDGGDAGLGWGRPGAGAGRQSCADDTASSGCTDPTAGGCGGCSAQPDGRGDQGSDAADDVDATGGGGGGGGGATGGQGGAGGGQGSLVGRDAAPGGGGGGAGSSAYDAALVSDPSIGTATGGQDDGYVVLLALTATAGYDNDGIGPGRADPIGFDGVGDRYDSTELAAAGVRPGGPVGVGPVVVTWPDVAPGEDDNFLANGRTLPLSGTGSTLAVVGASAFGDSSGTATVTYTDGSTSQFTLALPDWVTGKASSTTSRVVQVAAGLFDTQSVFGQLVAMTPGKRAARLTLPDISQVAGSGVTSMHVFAVGVGGPDNQGISTATGSATDGFGYFDGNGDAYAPSSLSSNGFAPGAQLTVLGAPTTWPSYAPGIADNYVARGQSVGLRGSGQRLVITGAASFGGTTGVSGVATITYQDGTTSSFTLGFADWIAGPPLPGQTILTTANSNQGGGGARIFATSTPLDPTKTVVAVTLPEGSPAVVGEAALHVFTLSLAPPTSAGADLDASLTAGPADVSATAVTGSAVPAGTPLRVAVRVDHLGGTDSGPYGLAILLPPGAEPTDLGGGQRLGPFVVFTGADLHPGGSDTRTLTITAPPAGISAITAATAGTTPDPTLLNNIAIHVVLTR